MFSRIKTWSNDASKKTAIGCVGGAVTGALSGAIGAALSFQFSSTDKGYSFKDSVAATSLGSMVMGAGIGFLASTEAKIYAEKLCASLGRAAGMSVFLLLIGVEAVSGRLGDEILGGLIKDIPILDQYANPALGSPFALLIMFGAGCLVTHSRLCANEHDLFERLAPELEMVAISESRLPESAHSVLQNHHESASTGHLNESGYHPQIEALMDVELGATGSPIECLASPTLAYR